MASGAADRVVVIWDLRDADASNLAVAGSSAAGAGAGGSSDAAMEDAEGAGPSSSGAGPTELEGATRAPEAQLTCTSHNSWACGPI